MIYLLRGAICRNKIARRGNLKKRMLDIPNLPNFNFLSGTLERKKENEAGGFVDVSLVNSRDACIGDSGGTVFSFFRPWAFVLGISAVSIGQLGRLIRAFAPSQIYSRAG